MMKYHNFQAHNDSERKESWYWNLLVKQYGSWKKAEKAVEESKRKFELNYIYANRVNKTLP